MQSTAAAPQQEREAHLQPAAAQVSLVGMFTFALLMTSEPAVSSDIRSVQSQEHQGAVQNQGRKRQKKEKPETHLQRLARHVQSEKVAIELLYCSAQHGPGFTVFTLQLCPRPSISPSSSSCGAYWHRQTLCGTRQAASEHHLRVGGVTQILSIMPSYDMQMYMLTGESDCVS